MHGHNGSKLPERGLPTVAKSSVQQLGYRPAEILTALLQVRFRQPLSRISFSGTAILWDLAGSNFTFDFVPKRGRFSRASWRDCVDHSFSMMDWTRLYRVMPPAKVPRLVSTSAKEYCLQNVVNRAYPAAITAKLYSEGY